MSEERVPIEDLPEGTFLYEESSIRRISQAIRAINGSKNKYSHRQQPDAIRSLKNDLFPTFMFGPAGLNSGCEDWNSYWGSSAGRMTFPNILYNAHNNEQNVVIIGSFDFTLYNNVNFMNFIFQFFGNGSQSYPDSPSIIIQCYTKKDETIGDNVSVKWSNSNSNLFTFQYDPGDELKLIIDTNNNILYVYVNDLLIGNVNFSQNTYVYNIVERYAQDELYSPMSGQFQISAGPLSNNGTDQTNTHRRSKINYFRIVLEDWE